MAGHSKWKQIKHKKAAADAKRGQLFSRVIQEIMAAVRAGGPNPDTNTTLKRAREKARSAGLPKENIERAILRASAGESADELEEFLYEVAAPDGVAILVEGTTDSKNRTLSEIKHLLAEFGARLAEPDSLIWNFERVGFLEVETGNGAGPTEAEKELAAVEAGATDLKTEDGILLIETLFADATRVRQELEKRGIKIKESGHDYKTRSPLAVSPERRTSLEKLLEALANHNDVRGIYTNLSLS